MDRVILHFDLDCFYAQVHMVQEPELRLKPLGVQQKTIFATVNYVARARGVPKMARISEAQRICPDIVIRNGEDLTDYREASEHIFAFLQEQFPHCPVERLGLDEFFVDATTPAHALCSDGFWSPTPHFHLTASPNWCGHVIEGPESLPMQDLDTPHPDPKRAHLSQQPAAHAAANLAQYQALRAGAQLTDWARKELKAKFGYTCSAGIAVNKLQAKMAGELHKPDDQSCLLPRAAQAVILHRGLRRVPGLGRAMFKRLQKVDLASVPALLGATHEQLELALGRQSQEAWRLVRGIDETAVQQTGPPKTLSNEDNIGRTSDIAHVMTRLEPLVHRLLARIDHQYELYQRRPRVLRLSVCGARYHDRVSRQESLPASVLRMAPGPRAEAILDRCVLLLRKLKPEPFVISVINVGVTSFDDHRAPPATHRLDQYWTTESNPAPPTCQTRPQAYPPLQLEGGENVEEEEDIEALFEDENAALECFTCNSCGACLPEFCRAAHTLFHADQV